MFFFGIFGIDYKEKEIRTFQDAACNNCGISGKLKLIKRYSFFHFFFIPLFKWNIKYYIVCTSCGAVYEINPNKGEELENDMTKTVSYWDLTSQISGGVQGGLRCPNCGRTLDKDFEYCPYCGKKI